MIIMLFSFSLTSTTSSHESQIVEFGYLILHHSCTIAKFRTVILIVAGSHRDHCAIVDVAERDNLECDGKCFVLHTKVRERNL